MQERIQLPESLEHALQDARERPAEHDLRIANVRTWQKVTEQGRRHARSARLSPWVTAIAGAACVVLAVVGWQHGLVVVNQTQAVGPDNQVQKVVQSNEGKVIYESRVSDLKIIQRGTHLYRVRQGAETDLNVMYLKTDDLVEVKEGSQGDYVLTVKPKNEQTGQLVLYFDREDHGYGVSHSNKIVRVAIWNREPGSPEVLICSSANNSNNRVDAYNVKTGKETTMFVDEHRSIIEMSSLPDGGVVISTEYTLRIYDNQGQLVVNENREQPEIQVQIAGEPGGVFYPVYTKGAVNMNTKFGAYQGRQQVWMYDPTTRSQAPLLPGVEGDQFFLGNTYGEQGIVYLLESFKAKGELLPADQAALQEGTVSVYSLRKGEQPKLLTQYDTQWRYQAMTMQRGPGDAWTVYANTTPSGQDQIFFYDPKSNMLNKQAK